MREEEECGNFQATSLRATNLRAIFSSKDPAGAKVGALFSSPLPPHFVSRGPVNLSVACFLQQMDLDSPTYRGNMDFADSAPPFGRAAKRARPDPALQGAGPTGSQVSPPEETAAISPVAVVSGIAACLATLRADPKFREEGVDKRCLSAEEWPLVRARPELFGVFLSRTGGLAY